MGSSAMISVLISLLLTTLSELARSRAALHFEVLALRHQLQGAPTIAGRGGCRL
jgi:hypothetical protein